jgi:hypothetical protein
MFSPETLAPVRLMAAVAVAVATMAPVAGCAEPSQSTSSEQATVEVSSTPPPGPQAAILGTALEVSASGATASYTVANLAPVPLDAQIIPARGTMYAVDVTIVAQSGTTVFNGFFFVAGDQDGATVAPAVGAVKPGITSGQLAAGQTVAGHIAFDVPEGRSITQVALRDPQGKTLAIWGSR